MMVILLVLLVSGFFFPPAWLGLAGYSIYIFSSRDSRRASAIESRVGRMVRAKQECAAFSDLYFEAARSYAISKGANNSEPDCALTKIVIDNNLYHVTFSRHIDGGTIIGVEDSHAANRRMENFFAEIKLK